MLILFEDEHLLVVNKPPGWNTHSPSPYAGEGIYEWLRHREPARAALAIIHRLDKETSGVLAFAKSKLANRSLTEQFTQRTTHKEYLLATDRAVAFTEVTVHTALVRVGEKYFARPIAAGSDEAETHFQRLADHPAPKGYHIWRAEPVTGRTHQIRVHAAARGFPLCGDTLYEGSPANRLWLHAERLTLNHPATGDRLTFIAPIDFSWDPADWLRSAVVDASQTDAYRLLQGAADGVPGLFTDRLGDYLLAQTDAVAEAGETAWRHIAERKWRQSGLRGLYHKSLTRHVRKTSTEQVSPQLIAGEAAPESFEMLENGLKYSLSFQEGYSVGLFLDQRDNRRRFLTNHIAADFPLIAGGLAGREVLNTFAYTCGFSVAAAKAGARVTSLDLSRKYLDWGKRNFTLNQLDPVAHDFIYGDVFDWLKRLGKKGRRYDVVILDPPTFSQSKEHGVFRAEKDYGELVAAALAVLAPDGVLLASTNAATLLPEKFLEQIQVAVQKAGRRITQQHYVPQPPDFPVSRLEPAYLKTVWLRIK